MIQRVITAAGLAYCAAVHIAEAPFSAVLPEFIGAGLGVFVLVGLWTPVSGTLVAIVELWIAYSHVGDRWIAILLATLSATLAMIGPGAWSVDARLFGRKHIAGPRGAD